MSKFRKAEKKKAKLRLAICGPTGAGKTYTALRIAKGMCGKVVLLDTERGSGDLYSEEFDYDVGPINAPFTHEKYIESIKAAEAEGYDIIIIDSLSHAWAGEGGILDEVESRKTGNNSFTAWNQGTKLQNRLIDTILESKCHIIVTMRSKMGYELERDEKGRMVPRKLGLAPVQREGIEYEFTVVLDMSVEKHFASSTKDRTKLFDGKFFLPTEETGKQLIEWLDSGKEPYDISKLLGPLASIDTMPDLEAYYLQSSPIAKTEGVYNEFNREVILRKEYISTL